MGFWGGVFGMGSVYLLVVFLRRLRKHLRDHRKNTPTVPRPEKRTLLGGYSAMFGQARNESNVDMLDLTAQQPHSQSHMGTAHLPHSTSTVPEPPLAQPPTALSAVTGAHHTTSVTGTHHPTSHREHHQTRMPKQQSKFPLKSSSHAFGLGGGAGFGGSSGGTRLKFSGFGLGGGLNRDDMADCQL